MTDLGKIDAAFFDRVVAGNLGAARDDVALGPTPGVDFGVLAVGDRIVVGATDPLSVLPALGHERAGRLALDVVLVDVAVSGIAPSHLTVSLTIPGDLSEDTLAAVWQGIDAHAREFDVSVVDVHAGRYPGVESSWIGAATAFGVGTPADLVRPDGARPGDALVVSTGPAAEVAGLFATLYGDRLDLPPATIATARERVDDVFAVADAVAAHEAGDVSAMHDATEGGIAGGLAEMADGAGVRFTLDCDVVPMADGVAAVCDAVDVDPWHVTSCGTLLMAVPPADATAVVDALEARGTPAAVVGRVESGSGVYANGGPVEPPASDPSWEAASRLAKK